MKQVKKEHMSMKVSCFKCLICSYSSGIHSEFDGLQEIVYKLFEFPGGSILL